MVNQPAALPNKKGADRKQRPPLAIDHLIDCSPKRERNRKGGPRRSESGLTALPNKKGADRKERPPLVIDHLIDGL